ncbi:MAG: SGNH/GDSL hydrolase family protein [Treponema sp.]|jgi:hypothetical protein|nr:SGNH/GDSL hydrolase family protein [Treponema sp.]
MDITKIDKNFLAEKLGGVDISFYDAREKPFRIYGLMYSPEQGLFHRFPLKLAQSISEGVGELVTHTSGGRVRFKSDSPYVAIKCLMRSRTEFPHMPQTGTSGFSLYVDGLFYRVFTPSLPIPVDADKGYEGIVHFPDSRMRDITIYFPLYNGVDGLLIGLEKNASPLAGGTYTHTKPVLFYGSSITQGGCASRPGLSYDAIACRALDSDYINIGLSGSCRAEPPMADYLSGLDISVFVYDYDHNAPDYSYLGKTHFAFYERFRKKNPSVPIIMMSRPDIRSEIPNTAAADDIKKRLELIRSGYHRGIASGDSNIFFINGEDLFGEEDFDSCTVDSCHPNDLGFTRMAKTFVQVLKKIL